jgi:hypothetical protein
VVVVVRAGGLASDCLGEVWMGGRGCLGEVFDSDLVSERLAEESYLRGWLVLFT